MAVETSAKMHTLEFTEPGPSSPKRRRETSPHASSSSLQPTQTALPENPASTSTTTALAGNHQSPPHPPTNPHPTTTTTTTTTTCALCSAPNPKYTCPRCHTKSCSLPCSKAHKAQTGCSGERNKAAYVGLNEYGWGSMMSDYAFLEDVGRKVGEWGKEIVKGGYGHGAGEGGRGRGGGAGRGGRGGRREKGGGKTKRDIFRMQMEVRDVDVEFLPTGMMRRKMNQSGWDFKKQAALLTIEFKFHKPRDPLAPSTQPDPPPTSFVTHRNPTSAALLSLLQNLVKERCQPSKSNSNKKQANPDGSNPMEWLHNLVLPSPEDPEGFTPPVCVMSAPIDPLAVVQSGMKLKKAWFKLDVNQPLISALKNTTFVEFPTIEVWGEFKGPFVDVEGRVRNGEEEEEDEPRAKRRKLSKKAGKERIHGLLGGYGSDGSEEEEEKEEKRNVMLLLGEYSDGEDGDEDVAMVEKTAEPSDEVADEEDEEETELEPAALMELLQRIKGDQWRAPDNGDDDVLEWGDDDLSDADAEGEEDHGDYEEIG